MEAVTTEELKKLRTIYFADFVENIMFMDADRYFNPYTKDAYLILPIHHIGRSLWSQHFNITHFIERNLQHHLFDKLFDKFWLDPKFHSFINTYKIDLVHALNMNTDDYYKYLENLENHKMGIYIKSNFRFDIDGMIKDFWQCIKIENRLDELYSKDWTAQQNKVCQLFVHHYINRLPTDKLPRFSATISIFDKFKNWLQSL